MADFSQIIQEINTNLPDNTTQTITAAKLRTTLIDLTNTIDTVQDDFEAEVNQAIAEVDPVFATNQSINNVSIVNNLTTGGINDVLSAEQGKVLNETIDDVSNSVSDLNNAKMDKSYPIYETSLLTTTDTQYQTGYFINYEGVITSASNFGVLGFDCTENQELLITGSFGSGPSCLGVFQDDNGNVKGLVLYKPNPSPYNDTVVSDYYCEVPSGATKIYIQTSKTLLQNPSCKLVVNTTYRQYSEIILQNETDIDSTQADLEQLQSDFDESIYTELTIPQTWTSGGRFAFTLNEEPSVVATTSYLRIWVQNLQVGDIITVRARSGSSAQTGAKTKNGVVVSSLSDNPSGTETNVAIRTYVVDNTFDGICFNNYIGFVHSPNYFCTLTRNENSIDIINGEIEDLQEAINTIIEQGVSKEYNILCLGNSFTQDTISYVPFLLREAEPNYKFNFYFTYMGGMPISQCRAFVGGDGTESIVYDGSGNITGKYVNHGGYDTIYSYTNGEWVVETSHKSYTLYKLAWDANAWTSQSEPTIETVLGIIGDKKWDLITIQQGGGVNYRTWDWYYKPYVYDIYATLKNRLNYNFKIGYLMTHSSYSTSAEELLSRYNGVLTNANKIVENTPTEVLLPYATALQNARTTYLTRFGSYIMDGAKIKNGFVVETFKKGSTDINITCDGTFDALILNNNNETVASPTCTLNSTTQTWTDGVMYGGLYQYAQPIERTSASYKSIYLTNLVNGDVIVSNNNTEDAGVCLLTDTAHVADGIGCLTCAYANTLAILDMIGSSKSIVGSQIVPNAEWITEHNIPSASRVYGLTRYNIWLAQQCAVMSKKFPLQLTDMVAKGMCGDTEIEIVNDTVYSSNPILSVNSGESWTTTLVAPDGMVISTVSVVMGSTDITSSVYDSSTHIVNIPNVSAKVTITATTV